MRCEDVNDCDDEQQDEQGHVKNVPKSKKTLVECKGRCLLGSANVLRHKILYPSKLLALNLLRPPSPLAFDRDHLPRIGRQLPTKHGSAPTDAPDIVAT
jgi:hypothetical protein